jgi:hypothetical protein
MSDDRREESYINRWKSGRMGRTEKPTFHHSNIPLFPVRMKKESK